MAEFTTRFGEIIKKQICTTSAELNFDDFTDEGTYEIYEDAGNGQTRVYFLTVDKSASGSCVSQTRLHCGTMSYRHYTADDKWTSWQTNTGGGSEGGYVLTDEDKEEIVNLVLDALPNGDEVSY